MVVEDAVRGMWARSFAPGRVALMLGGIVWLVGCGHATSHPRSDDAPGGGGATAAPDGSAGDGTTEVPGGATGGGAVPSAHAGTGSGGVSGLAGASPAGMAGTGAAGDTGGDPTLANLPLPKGCQASRGASTELLCSLDLTCGASAQTTHCYHTGSGLWQCTCDPPNADRTYLIAGAIELDACAVGAGLCAGPALDGTIDADSCVVSRDETGTKPLGGKTCTVELQCQRSVSVDFTAGVHVTMPGSAMVQCVEAGTADPKTQLLRVDCDATGSLGQKSYIGLAKGVGSACRPILDLYVGAKEATFDGSKTCLSIPQTPSRPGDCALSEDCFESAPVSGGVSLVSVAKDPTNRFQSCGFDDLGGLSCGCSFEGSAGSKAAIGYYLGKASKPAHCDLSQCTLDMKAEATAEGVCPASAYPSTEYDDVSCLDYFGCTQAATLAGKAVTLYSQLNVRCAKAKDGAYYCSCAAGDETATFGAGTLASSVVACDTARTACLDHLALPLGPAPTAGMPPDPLLGL